MLFLFQLAETLGVVDPRTLYHTVDSELLALWRAYYGIKYGTPDADTGSRFTEYDNVDDQVALCERLLA